MVQNLFEQIRIIFQKDGKLDKNWSSFMVNRFMSMCNIQEVRETAFWLDNYLFTFDKHDKEMLEILYRINIPKMRAPFIKYIKNTKDKEKDFKELIEIVQKYYHWTDKETEANKHLLSKIFGNKKEIVKILRFVGAESSLYRKLKVKAIKVEVKKVEMVDLTRWSK